MTHLVVRHKCHNSPSYGSSAYLLFSISSTTTDITTDITTDTAVFALSGTEILGLLAAMGFLHTENPERAEREVNSHVLVIHEQAYN